MTMLLSQINGVFAINKPIMYSSAHALNKLKTCIAHSLNQPDSSGFPKEPDAKAIKWSQIKLGHGGTLDPLATGVLVVGIGTGTKSLSQYLDCSKEYTVTANLGASTTTFDSQGEIDMEAPTSHLSEQLVLSTLPQFRGPLMQRPPIYSALKYKGIRMCDMARKVKDDPSKQLPVLPHRPVTIHTLDLVTYSQTSITLHVKCSKGTYIRSLVHDLGLALHSRAYVSALCRTRQAQFTTQMALCEPNWTLDHVWSLLVRT